MPPTIKFKKEEIPGIAEGEYDKDALFRELTES